MNSKLWRTYDPSWDRAKEYLDNAYEQHEQGEITQKELIEHVKKFSVMLQDILDRNDWLPIRQDLPTDNEDD